MSNIRRAIAVVVLVAAGGMAASIASAGQPPPPGQLDVTVVVGGDAGGSASDIRVDISRNSGGGVVETGFGSGSFVLDRGAYVIAATPVADGYTIDSIVCADDRNGNTNGGPNFVINGPGDDEVPYTPATCVVTATYTAPPPPEPTSQVVRADIVVVNDDGGTANGSEFTIEVFAGNGSLAASGKDPAPNDPSTSATFELPLGDGYRFGVSGPDGYTASVVVTPVEVVLGELIDGGAAFSLTASLTAAGQITVDDVAAPPEPTVPPTVPPTEPTVPPTEPTVPPTAPPTTDDQAAVPPAAPETPAPPVATAAPTIPVTGATDQTLPIALLALGLTMLGTGALVIARRN